MRKLSKSLFLLVLALSVALAIGGCANGESAPESERLTFFALDTMLAVTIFDHDQAEELLAGVRDLVEDLESKMSIGLDDSEVSKVNRSAGQASILVSHDTLTVVKAGLDGAKLTGGAFDPTIRPLMDLWQDAVSDGTVPDDATIQDLRSRVDHQAVKVDPDESTVYLEHEGMALDLGGIAKGYIGDRIVEYLQGHEVRHAMIDLGGDVLVMGTRADGNDWRIGVTDPRPSQEDESIAAIIETADRAVITSGDYQRYALLTAEDHETFRYHHILDPHSGYPADQGIVSVTVISEKAMMADALATGLFNMTPDEGIALIESLPGTDVLIITEDGTFHQSGSWSEHAELIIS